jgi:hypothetical protein
MLLGVKSTPFSFAEFPFSPPFSKQNGGELTLVTVPERSVERASRPTLAVLELSVRCGKQPPHPFQISDFLRASRPEARTRAGTLDRLMLITHTLDAACSTRGCPSSRNADRPASVGSHRYSSLPIWRQPSHA